MNAELLAKLTTRAMEEIGVDIHLGDQYSVKCQYAQVENIVRYTLEEAKRVIIRDIKASHKRDRYNGCGDGSMPLVDLTDAIELVNRYLTY